ncbi:transcription factor S-II, central domain-containing protein [Fusarium oxysporum f. sp. albedinis]|uniref:Transcription elongation factor n=7 Tax=Fusarium oxysporum TaxID=5507 RepID=W9IJS1_FUSOX|nr:transcription elongation factor S-II [Fusarium oxysporum f. sp. lycopersici 4287]XP_031042002.1 transcription factor S-II, central domain-containing protein [Fusarium oxysporum Fo47]EWY93084.1 transcription elongation factor S-II [Fusarium oxysporum NRRL 32931]EWZ90921.1 transcription elongation factor S-II [Fusarium oxysporum f. sp. lycopersici MN25]EXK48903.1 transcription elongation factor S-II [Fusarium oxysporum f. sp. melonis 26406]EXL43641.1 transcription elongation factor S-II [Fusa
MPMDERELGQRIKALTKCVAANEPPENAIKLLETLKKDASPTEEMLRATRAGVFVGKLRSNSNKDIARAAAELVNKWKKLVEQEKHSKLRAKVGSGSPAPAPSSAPASSPAAPPPPSSAGASGAKYKGDIEKRKYETDNVNVKRTDSSVRNSCIGLIYNGLAYRSTATENDVITRAVAVEHAAYTKFKGETPDYKKKIRSLFTNLKNKSNRELGRSVLSGEITAEKFVIMTDDELKSEEQRKKELELEKENMKKAQVPMAEKSISESLECGRCKKKQVSYTQAQTRAADEPMTTFCECMACGHRWKFS